MGREAEARRGPAALTTLLGRIDDLNGAAEAGFRRRAVPSLLYRYFAGMAEAMETWRAQLRPDEAAVVIVGQPELFTGYRSDKFGSGAIGSLRRGCELSSRGGCAR